MKDDRRVPSCHGKRLYADLPKAREMAKRTNNDRDARVAPYHCTRCHGWHVGEASTRDRRKPARVLED